ncbi:MAG TPA: pseudouridine synthase [Armatimonadota bacterium]|nr:pseudouridine synthase [Armatimonadota bacterium]
MPRLSKLIADAGIASRRKAADLVRAGRVRVDGETVTAPGSLVDPETQGVDVDGRLLQPQPRRYLLLNKPRGPISAATDERGRQTVLDLLPGVDERLYPAGRLDADTEGLLLITNDGDLTYRLTHPRFGIEKVYQAEVTGRPSRADLEKLQQGIMLEEGPTGPAHTKLLRAGKNSSRVEIAVHAGRKRMVRRMFEAVGHPVTALRRTRIGPLTLGDLKPGQWRPLSTAEITLLKTTVAEADGRSP